MIIRILDFLKLLDQDGGISWTTVSFIVVLGKIVISPSIDWAPLLAFAASNINYMHRRVINNEASQNASK